jgi:hypothetical protein
VIEGFVVLPGGIECDPHLIHYGTLADQVGE